MASPDAPKTSTETYIHRANVPFWFKTILACWMLFITVAISLPYLFFGAQWNIAFFKVIGIAMPLSNFVIFYLLFLNKKTVILIKSKN